MHFADGHLILGANGLSKDKGFSKIQSEQMTMNMLRTLPDLHRPHIIRGSANYQHFALEGRPFAVCTGWIDPTFSP
jgi:hypothetical protein